MDLPTLYHTGIVVDDLDHAMHSYGQAFGMHWAPPLTAAGAMLGPTGPAAREIRFTYSIEEPHHLELIEQVDATAYLGLTGGRRIHHIGYHTADLAAESARLESVGFLRELSGIDDDGRPGRATFHHSPNSPGMWIELLDVGITGALVVWLRSAAVAQGVPFRSPFP